MFPLEYQIGDACYNADEAAEIAEIVHGACAGEVDRVSQSRWVWPRRDGSGLDREE